MPNLNRAHIISVLVLLSVAGSASGMIPFWRDRPDYAREIFEKLGFSFGRDVDRVSAVVEILKQHQGDKDKPKLILNKYTAGELLRLSEYEYEDCADMILEKRLRLCDELSERSLPLNPHDVPNRLLMDRDIYFQTNQSNESSDHREPREFMVRKNLHNYCRLTSQAYRKFCHSVNQPVKLPIKIDI